MTDQYAKCETLAALHAAQEAWIIPNPWDVGSAHDLEKLGFKALATSSAACAYTFGYQDGALALEDKLAHCKALAEHTQVPVSVDFEDGYGNDPDAIAKNITRLADTGVAGCSIEDFSRVDQTFFDFDHAVERIHAAVEAVSKLPVPFQLVARAEGLIRRQSTIDDAIKRLQAFSQAGAHVLYAPGLSSLEDVQMVSKETDKPLNVLSPVIPGATVVELSEAGATRISLGNVLLEKARAFFLNGMNDMISSGAAS